ncbi:MAG: M3 family oligoendopeptidase [Candidatus Omnitrophota bacterium]|nr:M3 family oligoendopeptidase [Candidatus Omnitrophota bacterium]
MNKSTTQEMNFGHLAPYQQRRFVPALAQLEDQKEVTTLYRKLEERRVASASDLEQWMLDRSELEAALEQAGAILYIRMTCQTDDSARAQAYKDFITDVVPGIKMGTDQLNRKFLKMAQQFPLDQRQYAIYLRKIQADVDLFVEANVEIETNVELLSQEYQTIMGAMTVEFEGKEQTLPAMGRYLENPDRNLREQAWREMARRRLNDKDQLEDIFDKMLVLRCQIAQNAKCRNYIEYKFRSLHRFDYTHEDCHRYHASVEELVVPLWRNVNQYRRAQMKLTTLKPWDTAVDPQGRGPLKPFDNVDDLVAGCQKIFAQMDQGFAQQFKEMASLRLLDLENRKGKAPGGYQSTLDEARKPFIFMNAVGVDGDVRTLLHECGHAFHALACAGNALVQYRHGPMEFNEVASMAMELLADPYLSVFYHDDDVHRSSWAHWEDVIMILVWVATIDCFQQWIYEHPQHTRQQRREAWLNIRQRFGSDVVDWQGLEEEHAYLWHRQLHIFEYPFYYIEYGIAQLGALQVWRNSQQQGAGALANFKKALALGGSHPLPELYRTADIHFDFTQKTIAPLMEAANRELEQLQKF